MFILEITIILFSVLALGALIWRNSMPTNLVYGLILAANLVVLLHWGLGAARWQFMPVYVAVVLAALWALGSKFAPDFMQTILRRMAYILAPLGIGLTLLANWAFPMFELPAPSGPNAIGYREFYVADKDRAEDMTADPNDVRELMVKVWYPAVPDPAAPRKPYWQQSDVMSAEMIKGLNLPLPPFLLAHLDQVKTNAMSGAKLKPGDEKLPVLIFSHGSGLMAEQSTIMMEELASQGYVIFSINHPYTSLATFLPDGRIATFKEYADGMGEDPMGQFESIPEVAKLNHYLYEGDDRKKQLDAIEQIPQIAPGMVALEQEEVDRLAADQMLVLDKVEALNKQAGDPFENRLDLQNIGVFGFSSGGYASLQTCLVDERCAAGINIDGMIFASLVAPALEKPFMFITHIENKLTDILHDKSKAPVYSARLQDTAHASFTDLAIASNVFQAVGYFGEMPHARKTEIENLYVNSFFDKHLKGVQVPMLDAPAKQFPEVEYRADNLSASTS
ncbi:alpha/beta hydrolase family protein [Maritalea myrionectae]|uniref:alpha/beta hydrolase family protein n=1 Tax=Maritalea myrionectae TaxID=454601 RepID=UPI0004844DE1|nr:hypothetical protein [Maritalea myrionectae]